MNVVAALKIRMCRLCIFDFHLIHCLHLLFTFSNLICDKFLLSAVNFGSSIVYHLYIMIASSVVGGLHILVVGAVALTYMIQRTGDETKMSSGCQLAAELPG